MESARGLLPCTSSPGTPIFFDFLDLKKNHGKEEMRARDLFYALWMNDLFMQRVKDGGDWSLFDPGECGGLFDVHSGEFEALYHQYESEGRATKTVKGAGFVVCHPRQPDRDGYALHPL